MSESNQATVDAQNATIAAMQKQIETLLAQMPVKDVPAEAGGEFPMSVYRKQKPPYTDKQKKQIDHPGYDSATARDASHLEELRMKGYRDVYVPVDIDGDGVVDLPKAAAAPGRK